MLKTLTDKMLRKEDVTVLIENDSDRLVSQMLNANFIDHLSPLAFTTVIEHVFTHS